MMRIAAACLAVSLAAPGAVAQNLSGFLINCAIRPSQEIQLSTQTNGIIASTHVRPGQHVEKGDIIVQIDTDLAASDLALARQQASFDGAVRAARLQVESQEKRVNRLTAALNSKAISESEYDTAVLELDLARVSLERQIQEREMARLAAERAQILVEKATVRSPVDGIVGEDVISVGESTSQAPIAVIYVTSEKRVEAFVPVGMISQILEQEHPEIIVNDNAQNPVRVEIDYGSPLANLSSNTISVYYKLTDSAVLPGSKCQIKP